MLQLTDLTVAYDATPVFTDATVTFDAGKITGIIGPNGAGKSTLIKAALGLIKKQHGTATFNDRPLSVFKRRIAYVEQRKDLDLTFPISAFDVVLTGTYARLGLFNHPGREEKVQAKTALEQVELSAFGQRQIGNLSGGQLQRVFVARAIVQDATLSSLTSRLSASTCKAKPPSWRF